MKKMSIPLFKAGDLDATVGTFFDGFSKLIVAISVSIATLKIPSSVVFGTMMPGVVIGIIGLNGGLWLYYRRVAQKRNDPDLVAIPAGLQAGRIFIWLYSIMLPVYLTTGDAILAFEVGCLAHFIGGVVFIAGAFIVPKLLKILPGASIFGAVAGASLAFLLLQSINGVFNMPIVGWLTMIVLMIIYLGNVQVKIPAALIGIAVGGGVAWASGAMDIHAVSESMSSLGFYIPTIQFGIFSSEVIQQVIPYITVVLVFSINEVIVAFSAVEQAIECGDDHFTASQPIIISGIASMVSACFGNPLALGLYWGYPGWKSIKAGTGYQLGNVIIYVLIGLTGLVAIINAVLPEAAVLPLLIYVGCLSVGQGFEVIEKKYYPALILAILPPVMEFIAKNGGAEAMTGFVSFQYGSTFIGLIFGALFVYITDNNWLKASITCLVAMALTGLGMIHSANIIMSTGYAPEMSYVILYGISTVLFLILYFIKFNHKKEIEQ